MKGGILTLLLLTTLSWSSCSNEIFVSEVEAGREVMLSVDFQTDGLKMKSDDNEMIIQNRFIAAFRGDECTGIAYDDNAGSTLKIKAKTGTTKFIAVANANKTVLADVIKKYNENHTQAGYDALKGFESILGLYDFSDSMIKMTEEVIDLTLADTARIFKFRLFQLPAKVDFKVKVAGENNSFAITRYSVAGINLASKLILTDTTKVTNPTTTQNNTGAITDSQVGLPAISFYTYERETSNSSQPLRVTVSGVLTMNGRSKDKTYWVDVDPKVTSGDENSTNGIVHGHKYEVTGNINPKNEDLEVTVKVLPIRDFTLDVGYGEGETWK